MKRKYYGRFSDYTEPDISSCRFSDGAVIYEKKTAQPRYPDMEKLWEKFIKQIYDKMKEAMQSGNYEPETIGNELIYWAGRKDAFAVALILNMHREYCRKWFFDESTPKEVADLIANLQFSLLSGNSYDKMKKISES